MNNSENNTPMDSMAIGDLVNLTLGEHDSFEVLRVHGGWLYTRMSSQPSKILGGEAVGTIGGTVFVPEPRPHMTLREGQVTHY
jgi:hypothetical protein